MADRDRRGQELGRRGRRQADRRCDRLRRAGVRARERLHLRGGEEHVRRVRPADDREHLGGGRRDHGARGPRDLDDQLSDAQAYPIVSQTFLVAYKDPCKAGISQGVASGSRSSSPTRSARASRRSAPGSNQLPYAPLPSTLAARTSAARDDDLQWLARSRRDEVVEASRDHRHRRPLDSRAVAGVAGSRSGHEVGPDRARRGHPRHPCRVLHRPDRPVRGRVQHLRAPASSSATTGTSRRTSTRALRSSSAR